MKEQILKAFDSLLAPASTDSHIWVQPYEAPAAADVHQFVLFFKPEVTLPSQGAFPGVLDLTLAILKEWDIEIEAVRLLRGDYLEQYRIMDQHYGVLNAISKKGISAISPAARETLELKFEDLLNAGARVLGGHQLMEAEPEFSALAVKAFSDNLGVTKLGGGTYATPVKVLANQYIVLNAFHAYQLEPFCQKTNGIAVLDCRSTKPWADLRGKLVGATDPVVAEKGSIRNQLLVKQKALGLVDVNQSVNGVHLSAGPLEGMVEARRFFSAHEAGRDMAWSDFSFASLLAEQGLNAAQIEALTENPLLSTPDGEESAFDITEEMDARASAAALAAAHPQASV